MDQLGLEKAAIVGWSDGGIIGLDIAINHPERLTRVVAYGANLDPSGVLPGAEQNPKVGAYFGQAALDYQALSPQPERWDEFGWQCSRCSQQSQTTRMINCDRLWCLF